MMIGKIAVIALISAFISSNQPPANWPEVKPVSETFHVITPITELAVNKFIYGMDGKPIYRLQCGSFDTVSGDFNYSGDFECALQTVPADYSHSTYLTEDVHQDRDGQSRGRFFANEVDAHCRNITDFGQIRTFSLRRMELTLALSNIEFDRTQTPLRFKSFDFTFIVKPDDTATSAIAKSPLLDTRWRRLPCKLDNSVEPHFRADVPSTSQEP
jgi:hypothetical protein